MKLTNLINKQNILLAIFFVLFTLSYTANIFRISETDLFHGFERQPEGLVVGRLARSAQDGQLSYGGLTGINHDATKEQTAEQYAHDLAAQHDLYLKETKLPDGYKAYKTQSGGQAMLFGLIHKILPVSNAKKLMIFRGINALLIALVFCLFAGWVCRNYGFITSLVSLILIFISPWINMFSHNLWWTLWNFYLPFLTVLLLLEYRNKHRDKLSNFKIFALLFLATLLKCFFSGFEFITTTLISAICPIVYYSIKEKGTLWNFVKLSSQASIAMLLAVAAQMAVLVVQIKSLAGSFSAGTNHIAKSFTKRSQLGADDIQMSYPELLGQYLQNDAFQLGFLTNNTSFYFGFLFIIILLAGLISIYLNKENKSLIVAGAFSILAPLSWLIVFKQHSVLHPHMDYIIWYLPFLLYGFVIIGSAISELVKRLSALRKR